MTTPWTVYTQAIGGARFGGARDLAASVRATPEGGTGDGGTASVHVRPRLASGAGIILQGFAPKPKPMTGP